MSKSKFIIDKLAKLFEQGLVSYQDLSSEILNILRSKRDEIVFKMRLASKEETEIKSKKIYLFTLFFFAKIIVAIKTPSKPP